MLVMVNNYNTNAANSSHSIPLIQQSAKGDSQTYNTIKLHLRTLEEPPSKSRQMNADLNQSLDGPPSELNKTREINLESASINLPQLNKFNNQI